MKSFVLRAGVLALLPFAGSALALRPMTVEDLIGTVRVSDPQLSPDGRTVAFVRTTTDLTSGKRNADVFLVPADGSAPPRALTRDEASDTAPRFSPDGKSLAFLSRRGGSSQVWLIDLSGGEARKVTDVSTGADEPFVFSPDGKHIAFSSDVWPDCADDACNKKKEEAASKDPVKVHHLTRLLYRHWDEWREGVRKHVLVADVATGATRDVTPGDFDAPTVQYEDDAVAFSPDGKEIAFVSNRDGNDQEAWSTNMDIWVASVDGGKAERLTTNRAADVTPVFTPDGRSVIVKAQRRPGLESDRWYLDVIDRKTKTARTLFTTPDLSIGEFALSRDGKTVYFVALSAGRDGLYAVPFEGGTPRLLATGGHFSSLSAGSDGLVFSRSSLTAPPDVHRVSLDGKGEKALTHENPWLADVDLEAPEMVSVKGAAGADVSSWLVKPPAFDPAKKYPTVFLIHGGPQGAWSDSWSYRWNPSLWAAQGWVVVCPNPRGSTGQGQKFVDEISQDWGGKVMVDLAAVFDDVSKKPFVDAKRLGIAGASYGGYAVDWILGHDARFSAAVTHDGVFNLESMTTVTEELWFTDAEFGGLPWSKEARANFAKWSPHLFADKIVTPTLVITNEKDYRVPVDQGLQLFTVLRRRGIPSEALVFPDEGHWVLKAKNSQRWHETVFGWMKKYL